MYYKLSRLLLTSTSNKPSTTAEVFISNPQIDQESLLGKLFFVGEIDSSKAQALKIINFLISYLEQTYYQNEKISLREKMGIIKISEIFENALTKTNAEFENFLKKEKIKIPAKSLNFACGVIFKNELVFSSIGSIKTIIVYPEQDKSDEFAEKKIYKINALNEQNHSEQKPNLHKIFSNITEGKIPPEGYVVFMNEILPEYITNKHLTKIITTLPPGSAIEHIKNQLSKINSYVTFLALIIKNSSTPHIQRSIPKMNLNITANNSLEQMQETESETEKYLSPAGMIKFNRLTYYLQKIPFRFTKHKHTKLTTTLRDKIFFARKDRLRFWGRFKYFSAHLLNIIIALLIYILKALSNPKKTFIKITLTFKQWLRLLHSYIIKSINWFTGLNVMLKSLLIIFVVAVSLFSYNIYYIINQQHRLELEQQYKEITELITQKQNQINSSLLYKNETHARELLEETQSLIDQLYNYPQADSNLINNFKKENEAQIAKISHIINVSDHTEIAQLKNLNPEANPQQIILLNNQILVSAPQQSELYAINIDNKSVNILTQNDNIDFAVNVNDKEALFMGDKGNGIIVDQNNNIDDIVVNINNTPVTALASYNDRIYVLSSSQNAIIRFNANYNTRTNWLKEDLNINTAVNFDIDGYIYLLENNGQVIKLLSGYHNDFNLDKINPQLSHPVKIKLTGDSDEGFIYILEPDQQRIVVFKKTGEFVLQYKIAQLTKLKDFIVLEEEKIIFLLNDSAVYQMNMTDFPE